MFYLIPWIMFVVAASTASNVVTASTDQSLESAIKLGNVFRYAFIAIFGFVSGIVIDRVGRKQTIILGMMLKHKKEISGQIGIKRDHIELMEIVVLKIFIH